MNDTMSVLLATTILALGGLGLYMYKSSDDNKDDNKEENYDEESIFGTSNLFNWGGSSDDKIDDDLQDLDEDEDIKPRRRNTKTIKNRKSVSSSRRRY